MIDNNFYNPAVKFINSINYPRKLIFLLFILFFPVICFVVYNASLITSAITKIENEKKSLKIIRLYKDLAEGIPKHRGLVNGYLKGEKDFLAYIYKVEKDVDESLLKINEIAKYENELLSAQYTQYLLDVWGKIKLEVVEKDHSLTPKDIFVLHTKLIGDILGSIQKVTIKSGMSSDQDLKTAYLVDLITTKILNFVEILGQARGVGTGIVAMNEQSYENKKELIILYGKIESEKEIVKDSLFKHKNYNPKFLQDIKKQFAIVEDFTLAFILNFRDDILDDNYYAKNPNLFFDSGTATIRESFKLFNIIDKELENILNKRILDLKLELYLYIFFALAGILINIYIFVAFYISIVSSMNILKDGMQKFANGEIKHRININTQDEMGLLAVGFNKMAESFEKNLKFLNGYRTALDKSNIVSISNPKGIITYANEEFLKVSKYSYDELIGKPHSVIRHPDVSKDVFVRLWKTIKSKKVWNGIIKNLAKDGSVYYVDATIVPILDEKDEIVEFISIRHDITELVLNKELLYERLYYDELTKLPKRTKLMEDLRDSTSISIALVNINGFSKINDYYGYETGNKILIEVSNWLLEINKDFDADVYKLHADEFAIMSCCNSISDRDNFLKLFDNLTSKIFAIDNQEIVVQVTIGVAFELSTENYINKSRSYEILENADIALKNAQKKNKKVLIYNDSMINRESYKEYEKWVKVIQEAISNDKIVPFFQPIYSNKENKVVKYECLVRLIDRNGEYVTPNNFLDISKKFRLYQEITKNMIEKSINLFADSAFQFSVNISIEDIENKEIVEFIKSKIKTLPKPELLVFEILESEEIKDYFEVSRFVEEVKSLGCKVAIDDFGSGYSNFSHILKLKVDYLKIDSSLIKNIDKDKNSEIIVKTIVEFSKGLNIQTIAEFVHSKEVLDKIISLGVDYSQGYYISEPKRDILDLNNVS